MEQAINYPTAENYQHWEHRKHVYLKSDTYIGSDEPLIREVWLFDVNTNKMSTALLDFVPGCEQLFLEILTNAADNVNRSRRAGVDPGSIDILMNNSTVSITNYGLPIPIEIHPQQQVYVPQMIFGDLLTSSNYEGDRHEAGTNGIGSKATNVYSTEFMVIIHDHVRHKKYTQVWTNNMINRSEPFIEDYQEKVSSVQVVYKMDFARFKYPVPTETSGGYPPEVFPLFTRHAVDTSFTSKVPVSFNGIIFNYPNIRDYARLYFGDAVDTAFIHYQWPPGTELTKKKEGHQVAKNPWIMPEVELIAVDTPDDGHHVSFANCMMTKDGGVHVNAAIKAVGEGTVQMINDAVLKKLVKQNKGKDLDAKDRRSHTININDVKPHISILLTVKVVNPKFSGQTKGTMTAPVPKITIGSDELKVISNWQLIDRLYATIEAKSFASLAKTDGNSGKYLKLSKGQDANDAGKPNKQNTILWITEGDSGATYAENMIGLSPGGRDKIGLLPMRGKGLNCMNASILQLEENKEICELKKMLGLREGTDYTIAENFAKLRYENGVMIMADADVDGFHIIGLILNFFFCRFPSLLLIGYVRFYRTPLVRATFNKTVLKFYTAHEYEDWKASVDNLKSWKQEYFKGLGTSTDADIKDDYKTPKVVCCVYDKDTPKCMHLAFDDKLADERKKWIESYHHLKGSDTLDMQPISYFINYELILHSIDNMRRCIPKLDGFKQSHRKIFYAAHLRWKIGSKKEYTKFKVAQFSGFVTDKASYHHGEDVLHAVIIKMAQNATGTNNIPLFRREGQFGTRYNGLKAAKPRYIFTRPERIVQYIFRKEDRPILEHLIEEGEEAEPSIYYPIIPLILVNGESGIATGHSTTIPAHNPLDIINWLRLKLKGASDKELPFLIPWYNGFTGTINLIDRRKRAKSTDKVNITVVNNVVKDGVVVPEVTYKVDEDIETSGEILEDIENEDDFYDDNRTRPLLSMTTFGKFHMDTNGTIIITELPIGRWSIKYRKWLEDLTEKKKITGFRDCSVKNNVYFEIYGFPESPNYRNLKLQRTMGMSNMVILNDNWFPQRFNTAGEIMQEFYCKRMPIYFKRKNYMIANLNKEIATLNDRIRFIRAILNKEIRIKNRKKADIKEAMIKMNIPTEILDNSKLTSITEDDINALMKQISDKENEIRTLSETTPEQIWLNELDELEKAYMVYLKTKDDDDDDENSKRVIIPGKGKKAIIKQPMPKAGAKMPAKVSRRKPKESPKVEPVPVGANNSNSSSGSPEKATPTKVKLNIINKN